MRRAIAAATAMVCLVPVTAGATNGTFATGYGMKNKGMGGIGVVNDHDAMGGATNPASFAFVGNRVDVGLDFFMPTRSAQRTGSGGFGAGSLDTSVKSGSNLFEIPEMGVTHSFGNFATGLTLYGNGGLNTDYPGGTLNCGAGAISNMLCGQGRMGIDLQQFIVAPGIAAKLDDQNAIGIAPLFGYQRFRAQGLQAFDNPPGFPPFTSHPGHVTNNGYDSSSGFGFRVGYQGNLERKVTVGISYASKIRMKRFDKYDGLIAEQGRLDVPANLQAGLAIRPLEKLTLATEWGRIFYSDVKAFSNPSSANAPLGANDGKGFGWSDINVWKVGAEYQVGPATLRAGYDYGENPVGSEDVTVNILAPGITQRHLSAGATVAFGSQEITFAYIHAFENRVRGASLFNAFGPGVGGEETIKMSQEAVGLAWGWRM